MGGERLQEAAAAHAACLAAREHALGPQHPDTAVAMLGACHHLARSILRVFYLTLGVLG